MSDPKKHPVWKKEFVQYKRTTMLRPIPLRMKIKASDEQDAVAKADFSRGLHIVNAYAGTGKTSTLQLISEENQNKKILYLTFNRSMAEQSRERFGMNCKCSTIHALAYSSLSAALKKKVDFVRANDLYLYTDGVYEANHVKKTIDNFCYSVDTEIGEKHVPSAASDPSSILAKTKKVIEAMLDEKEPLKLAHDVYLKTWATKRDKLDEPYDFLMLDEAQDTNPVTWDLILRLHRNGLPVVLVGDMHQSIYAWRGASDAMRQASNEKHTRYNLTNSYRLTHQLARDTTLYLNRVLGDMVELKGVASANKGCHRDTILSRSNAVLIRRAYELVGKFHKRVHWVGTAEKNQWKPDSIYNFDEIYDVLDLYMRKRVKSSSAVSAYRSWEELAVAMDGDETSDQEMRFAYELVSEFGRGVTDLIKTINRNSVDPASADVFLTTAHKSKGLEWDNVTMMDDFLSLKKEYQKMDGARLREERNLKYVAMTRAKCRLEPSRDLLEWLNVQRKVSPDAKVLTVDAGSGGRKRRGRTFST